MRIASPTPPPHANTTYPGTNCNGGEENN
jgi:hypothetical protein